MSKKVCIVTPDLIGPIKNGGVGTYAYHLGLELVENNYDTTIIFTGPCFNENNSYWIKYYEKLNIKYLHVNELFDKEIYKNISNNYWFIVRSYIIYKYLKENFFDIIYFQEWQANGFHTIQAKNNCDEFQNTLITVTMHSSTQWINQGMRWWNEDPIGDTQREWCERYCCKNCDLLISPSKYMFEWALDNGWELNENKVVIPYCFQNQINTKIISKLDLKHLIFFGRLETRKGLEIFCDSVLEVMAVRPDLINKISFVGKDHECNNMRSSQYIKKKFLNKGINYEIHSRFNSFEAINYLIEQNGVVVIPSKLDNYPYTVIECIENKISFIASKIGGIPEMVDEKILFEPDVQSLANKLLNLEYIFKDSIRHKYSKEKAKQLQFNLHIENINQKEDCIKQKIKEENPLVSVCIPYYNYGKYLPQLLESIFLNTYKNYEVIVVNDGSTEEESIKVFEKMQEAYMSDNWCFIEKENGGIGQTRNFAVEKSNGKYIIFMDADNIATPNMIYDFVYGMYKSGADCLTCHYNAFRQEDIVNEDTEIQYKYMPIGPILEVGFLQNVFGDATFIIKKEVFKQLGGFGEDKKTSWEDYEFLIRLNLQGNTQDVIPKSLFWYRVTDKGFSRKTNLYDNYQRILKAYNDNSPSYFRFSLNSLVIPLSNKVKAKT